MSLLSSRSIVELYLENPATHGPFYAAAFDIDGFAVHDTEWMDVSSDVILGREADYGIKGGGPNDRTAGTGTFKCTLNNSNTNSAKLNGYYSPGHPNCRRTFDINTPIRWRIPSSGTGGFYSGGFDANAFALGQSARVWFTGHIEDPRPTMGQYGERRTSITAVDWFDIAATTNTSAGLQVSKRMDEILNAILDAMDTQPTSRSVLAGDFTFKYALDNVQDERTKVLAAIASLMASEGGFCYQRGDGTLVGENNSYRALVASAVTFNDNMQGLEVSRSRADIFNKFFVIAHPRRVDAAATTVLYSLGTTPQIAVGQSITMIGPYGDPLNANKRCGGTNLQAPIPTTDYSMNSAADGSGTDLTAFMSVVASFTGNGVHWTLANTGVILGYVTKLQCRGQGIYDFQQIAITAKDAVSITKYEEQVATVDMQYQDDVSVASVFAAALIALYSMPTVRAPELAFMPDLTTELKLAATDHDIGTRITVNETQTGVSGDFFIQGVNVSSDDDGVTRVKWGLAPAP